MIASRRVAVFSLVLASLYVPWKASAAGNTFDLDVNELDKPPTAQRKTPPKKPKAPKPKKTTAKPIIYSDGYAKYTVQESDFRTRILAKHLHISEEELQRLMPDILRLNGISSLSELEIGQTLIVPLQPPQPKVPPESAEPAPSPTPPPTSEGPTPAIKIPLPGASPAEEK